MGHKGVMVLVVVRALETVPRTCKRDFPDHDSVKINKDIWKTPGNIRQ